MQIYIYIDSICRDFKSVYYPFHSVCLHEKDWQAHVSCHINSVVSKKARKNRMPRMHEKNERESIRILWIENCFWSYHHTRTGPIEEN